MRRATTLLRRRVPGFAGAAVVVIAAIAAVAVAATPARPPTLSGASRCPVFPPTSPWNLRVDRLPVARDSARVIARIGLADPVHPDFGTTYDGAPNGIPFTIVSDRTRHIPVRFQYASESDGHDYPLPPGVAIEGGARSSGDRHVIVIDRSTCLDYELYAAYPHDGERHWTAGSGAIFNLRSNRLRPAGWTSADAAGLPILPGLARYDEVAAGAINHALRFTAPCTGNRYVYPARHDAASCSGPDAPPMGLRVRLKASVDISRLPDQARVLARAMKRYGLILADNGSPWFVSGAPSRHWNDSALHQLDQLSGRDFQVVDTRSLPHPGLGPGRRPMRRWRARARDENRPAAISANAAGAKLAGPEANAPMGLPSPPLGRASGAASVQITDRDRVLLGFAAEQRFVIAAQIAVLLGVSETTAAGRLRALGGGGYLHRERKLHLEPMCHRITRTGLSAVGSDLPTPRRLDLATYRHDLGLGWLMLAAYRGRFGAVSEVISERHMRSHDGRTSERADRFGVRLGGTGPGGRERLHYPDAVLLTATGHRAALELELSTKVRDRRERILSAYGADRRIDAVVYLVERSAVGAAIERSARRVGASDILRVQRVTLGGSRADAAAGSSAERQHRRVDGGGPPGSHVTGALQ